MSEKEKRIFLLKIEIEDSEKWIKYYSKKIDDLNDERYDCEGDYGWTVDLLKEQKTELNELQKVKK